MSDWKVTYDYITSTDSLDRQRMLALTGTVLAGSVAGCSGGADEETAAGDTDGSGDDDSDDGSEATDASETEESRPDVVVVEEEMTDDTYTDTEYAKIVEFEVENQGDGRSGPVDIAVDWFDSNGEKTGDERRDIPFLPADTTWASFVPSIYEFDTPDSYELELEVDTELEEQPEVTVSEITVEVEEAVDNDYDADYAVFGKGEAEYDGDTEINYLTTKAIFYDEQGRVVWSTSEKRTSVDPAGAKSTTGSDRGADILGEEQSYGA